jgi:adenine/guanine/hypoxanthine permease
VIFTLLFVDLFDTAGTLIGVAHRGGTSSTRTASCRACRRRCWPIPRRPWSAPLLGTSNTTSYIESAAGVAAGGRTGLTAVFVGILFLLALFFSPLAGMIPAYASAAALLYVACVMARGLAEWTGRT